MMPRPLRHSRFRAPVVAAPVASDDAALVVRARGGDRWAHEAIFRRHVDAVLSLATRMLGRTGEADDVAQDTFAVALTRLDRLDEPERLRSWLLGIAVHRVQRRLRQRRWLSFFGLDSDEGGGLFELVAPGASPEVRGELVLIDAMLERLPVEQRVAWMLRHVEGEALADIATMTSVSLATVKRRIDAAERAIEAAVGEGSER